MKDIKVNRIFLNDSELIKKLEKRSGIEFSKTTKELYDAKGYYRLKKTLIFMRSNNIEINNKSIVRIYRNEKHLRHMLMPKLESFEMILKNHTLHEVMRIAVSENIFSDDRTNKKIFINKKQWEKNLLISNINHSIRKQKNKSNGFDICNPDNHIYDWFYGLTFGNLVNFFTHLKPKIKREILLKSFGIEIDTLNYRKDLNIIRELRNKIAHAEQLFSSKHTYLGSNGFYVQEIIEYIKKSQFKKLLDKVEKHLSHFLGMINKYQIS